MEQLKLQNNVLQKLREAEGRRRSEAANESFLLRERIEKQQEEIEKLYEVNICKFLKRTITSSIYRSEKCY